MKNSLIFLGLIYTKRIKKIKKQKKLNTFDQNTQNQEYIGYYQT